MRNIQTQLQNDISNAASNMMTQYLCAEKGIDFNQLQEAAAQAHMNAILAQETQRQQEQIVKRHYQGDSFFAKIRDVIAPAQPMTMFAPQPQQPVFGAAPQPFFGQPAPQAYVQHPAPGFNGYAPPMNPQQTSQFLHTQTPQPAPSPEPVSEPATQDIRSLVESIVHDALANIVVSQPQQPPYPATGVAGSESIDI